MIICLDIGNTHVFGGVLLQDKVNLRFRFPSSHTFTSDTFGLFLLNVLEKNGLNNSDVKGIVMASVVPAIDYSIQAACKKYFKLTPLELKPGIKTGVKLAIKNPLELGADRLAGAVAAIDQFPKQNLIVVDFGTATTICAIDKEKNYLGGAILPGFKLFMESLSSKTALLAAADIVVPKEALGKTTETNLQSGAFWGQFGAVKEISERIIKEAFPNEKPVIIATGGYAHLFNNENYFDHYVPDLVLNGLKIVWEKNQN